MADSEQIRLAGPTDLDDVTRLIAGFRDYYDEAEPSDATIRAMAERLLADGRTEFLLAGDPPAGVLQLRFRPSIWTGTDDAWLEDVFVEPGARGEGAGRALIEACVERALARGCRRIQLDVNERNDDALRLYDSLGFSASMSTRFEGARNLYMTKRL